MADARRSRDARRAAQRRCRLLKGTPGLPLCQFDDNRTSELANESIRKGFCLRSLRMRLILILALLAAAALSCGFIMLALFQQSATAQIGQATADVGHACDSIGRAYRFYTTGWREGPPDLAAPKLRRDLNAVAVTALRDKPGIEGGIWHADAGALAYAFPTYEGAGPKTDIPQAELPRITSVNSARSNGRPSSSGSLRLWRGDFVDRVLSAPRSDSRTDRLDDDFGFIALAVQPIGG